MIVSMDTLAKAMPGPVDPEKAADAAIERALEIARKEGRLDGRFSCEICGMRSHDPDEADECCAELVRNPISTKGPAAPRRVNDGGFEW